MTHKTNTQPAVPNVPALRFPEFQNDGDWEKKIIKTLLNTIIDNRGKTPPVCLSGIPLIEANALGNRDVNYQKITKYVNDLTYKDWFRKQLTNNDILFTTVGKTAVCSLYKENIKSVIAQNIIGLRFEETNNQIFMYYLIIQKNNNHQFKNIEMVAIQPSIKVSQMVNLSFSIPTLIEQQKIADCLSSLDDLITAQNQQLDALKAHKKGLMQQLFPVEGSTIPALRFPEFQNAPEWENKKINDIAVLKKGTGLSKSKLTEEGKYKCILYGELFTTYNESIKEIKSRTDSSEGLSSVSGDILIPASTTTSAIDLAKAVLINESGTLLGGDINIIRPASRHYINSMFLTYMLTYVKTDAIAKLAQGITIIHLYGSSLLNLNISTPKYTEQQKIADCLSSLDDLITAQQQKIDTLKQHKKGLMQQLFPNNN